MEHYTAHEAAKVLRVSYRTIYRLIERGTLKAKKTGFGLKQKRYLINKEDINKLQHE